MPTGAEAPQEEYIEVPAGAEQQVPEQLPMPSMQEQQFPPDYGMQGDMFRKQREDSIGIIKELNPNKILEEIRHHLKGEVWDTEKGKYDVVYDPLMNSKGIGKYLSILATSVSSLITFSHFKEESIPKLVLFVYENVIPVLHINHKEYGIRKSNLPILDNQIFILTLAAFKKAVNAGERNLVGRTISENIYNHPQQQQVQQKRGFMSRLLNPFKK